MLSTSLRCGCCLEASGSSIGLELEGSFSLSLREEHAIFLKVAFLLPENINPFRQIKVLLKGKSLQGSKTIITWMCYIIGVLKSNKSLMCDKSFVCFCEKSQTFIGKIPQVANLHDLKQLMVVGTLLSLVEYLASPPFPPHFFLNLSQDFSHPVACLLSSLALKWLVWAPQRKWLCLKQKRQLPKSKPSNSTKHH